MWCLLKNSITISLVILQLCIVTTSCFDLSVVCSVCDYMLIMAEVPKECTAVVEYTSSIDDFPVVQTKRGSLPLIVVLDFVSFRGEYKKITDMVAKVNTFEYDYIVFDLSKLMMYYEPLNFKQFIQEVKPKAGAKLGLLIAHDVEWYREKFDIKTTTDVVDIYVLESIDYKECKHHEHQANMEILATKEDVEGSIKCLLDMGVPKDKLLYTIDLRIRSKTRSDGEPMDYSYLCENKLSVFRKYCFNTIQNIFDKARLRIQYNTTGILVKNAQYDDMRGTCGCTTANDSDPKFRGLKTIAQASKESVQPETFYECTSGKYPIIN